MFQAAAVRSMEKSGNYDELMIIPGMKRTASLIIVKNVVKLSLRIMDNYLFGSRASDLLIIESAATNQSSAFRESL